MIPKGSETGVSALMYHGGKTRSAAWIASILPWTYRTTYIEPFGGMAAVLLRRKPVYRELLNDRSERLINWWRVVRDQPDEFNRLVQLTPYSRIEFDQAYLHMDDPSLSPIRRALAFHVVVEQSVLHGEGGTPHWARWVRGNGPVHDWKETRIGALAQRLAKVQLDCADGVEILSRCNDAQVVAYCDPPYMETEVGPYAETVDRGSADRGSTDHEGASGGFRIRHGVGSLGMGTL